MNYYNFVCVTIIFFFIESCKFDNSSISTDLDAVPYFSLQGYVYEKESDTSIVFVPNVHVKLDSDSTITTSTGFFKFDSILSGTYNLYFQHNYYASYDTLISVDSSTNINISLSPILGDFFPLSIGSELCFDDYEYSSLFSQQARQFVGSSVWSCVNTKDSLSFKSYQIYEIRSGYLLIEVSPNSWDSTEYEITNNFSIVEDSSGQIIVPIIWYLYAPHLSEYKFNRFNPIKWGDTLYVKNFWYNSHQHEMLFCVIDKGLALYKYGYSGNSYFRKKLILKEIK